MIHNEDMNVVWNDGYTKEWNGKKKKKKKKKKRKHFVPVCVCVCVKKRKNDIRSQLQPWTAVLAFGDHQQGVDCEPLDSQPLNIVL